MKTLFFFFVLFSAKAWAAEGLSFAQSVEILLRNNSELQAAKANLDSARAQMNATYSNFLPQVSGNIGYSRAETNDVETANGFNASLSASQNLFNGFADLARLDDARAKVAIAEAQLRAVKAKLSADLKNAFAQVIYAQDSIRLSESILRRRRDNLNIVDLRFKSGRENKGSVLLSEAYLMDARLNLTRARNQLSAARSDLARVLGTPGVPEIEIHGGVPELILPSTEPDFSALALSVPDRENLRAQLQSAEAGLSATRAPFLPTLTAQGTLGNSARSFFPEENRGWSVGVTLSWSLFSGGRDYFSNKAAFAQKLVAENGLRNLDMSLSTSLRQTYAALLESREELQVAEAFASASMVRADIGKGRYNNGLIGFDAWDLIENELIRFQRDLDLRKRNKISAEAAWERALGTGVLP